MRNAKPINPLPAHINIETLREKLNTFAGNIDNSFEASQWQFQLGSKMRPETITLDFTPLMELENTHRQWSKTLDVDVIFLVKFLWLESGERLRSSSSLRGMFHGLCLLLSFMAQEKLTRIGPSHLKLFFEYMLMHRWVGKPLKTLSVNSYGFLYRTTQLDSWHLTLKIYKLPIIVEQMTSAKIDKALKEALSILSEDELTISDWKQGGSFNYLTLDYGRYYVEYCTEFFEQNIDLAIALSKIKAEARKLMQQAGLSGDGHHYLAVHRILSGDKQNLAQKVSAKKELLREIVAQRLLDHITPLTKRRYLLSEEGLNQLAKILGPVKEQHTIERLKFIVEQRFDGVAPNLINHLIDENNNQFTISDLDNAIDVVSSHAPINILLPQSTFYTNLGFKRREDLSDLMYSTQFLSRVRDAGITVLLALCGWRKSEFAFPLSAITTTLNSDALDQISFPFRYLVKWHVFKTNGDTQEEREITYHAYRYVRQLAALHAPKYDQPALYSANTAKARRDSTRVLRSAVTSNWTLFVNYYQPFKLLANQEALEKIEQKVLSGQKLTAIEKEQLTQLQEIRLKENSESIAKDQNLIEAQRRATEEVDRIELHLKDANSADKQRLLLRYQSYLTTGICEIHDAGIKTLDKHLSQETKNNIMNLDKTTLSDRTFVGEVMSEMLSGCLYPTPAAFRHMWAEAVYRRFDGDAGWMIRSQFKHISQNMWLAYIKSKDSRRAHDKVKINVISSLLNNWLQKEGKEHSGKYHHYLRLIYRNTKITPLNSQSQDITQFIKNEIEDIKANPWGYCILRKRNKELAKCAIDGIPQRHNAAPRLCLNCTNNLTKTSNVDNIIFLIEQHVDLLSSAKTRHIPKMFQQESYDTIRHALKHISALDPENEFIKKIHTAMKTFESKR